MNNKQYFIPAIDDIRIGYECEFLLKEFVNTTGPAIEAWVHATFNKYGLKLTDSERIIDYPNPYGLIQNGYIRVPYLTKEQIEREGWNPLDLTKGFAYRAGVPSYRSGFEKGNYFLVLDTRKYHIEIGAKDVTLIDFMPEFPEAFRVTIPCKDINTFRFLIKLLEV